MRNVDSHYGHAELVNRRARIGVVLIPVVAVLGLLSFDAFGDEGTTEPTVLAALVDGSTSTTAEAAVAAGSDGVGNRPATGTTIPQQ
ncbi:MAG: hypothetical protein OER12_01530, partial [Acidimicrobiia bacterium]|nr:hypothetical protein [Acidimicrobiia bacterium]